MSPELFLLWLAKVRMVISWTVQAQILADVEFTFKSPWSSVPTENGTQVQDIQNMPYLFRCTTSGEMSIRRLTWSREIGNRETMRLAGPMVINSKSGVFLPNCQNWVHNSRTSQIFREVLAWESLYQDSQSPHTSACCLLLDSTHLHSYFKQIWSSLVCNTAYSNSICLFSSEGVS